MMMGHRYCQRSWQLLVPLPDLGCHAHAEGVAHTLPSAAERRSNSTEGGRGFRIPTVPDEYIKECLALPSTLPKDVRGCK